MTESKTDTLLKQKQSGGHWYRPDGTSQHTVMGKSGERKTTLGDARKMGLYPSVTSILSIKAKDALTTWKVNQGILAALTLPRGENEALDVFAARVIEDMGKESEKAAAWGTKIHEESEGMHKTGVLVQRDETYPYLQSYEAWFKENIVKVIHAEKTIVNTEFGYAGRVDLVAEHKEWGPIVLDTKTQKVKEKPAFYEEWGLQLAAYRDALMRDRLPSLKMVSVVIDSGKPSSIGVKLWENEGRYFDAFVCCLKLWMFDKNYNPLEVTK